MAGCSVTRWRAGDKTLIFHDGIDLPDFAAFPLLDDQAGSRGAAARLRRLCAMRPGVPARSDSRYPKIFRASPDWAAKVRLINRRNFRCVIADAVSLLRDIRADMGQHGVRIVMNGAIGLAATLLGGRNHGGDAAKTYHLPQIQACTAPRGGRRCGQTMTHRRGDRHRSPRPPRAPVFPPSSPSTVETDGSRCRTARCCAMPCWRWTPRPTGAFLYMVNCAHPTHIAPALEVGGDWLRRMGGVRADPSPRAMPINKSTSLEDGDPVALAKARGNPRSFPHFCLSGGCGGSDSRHAERIGLVPGGLHTTGAARFASAPRE